MGWTYCDRWPKATSVRDELRRNLGGLLEPLPRRTQADAVVAAMAESNRRGIVKDALVAYSHRYYAAFRPGDGSTTIICSLLNHGNDGTGDCWGYKDMDESCGPTDVDCPLSILDLATDPAPNEWATEWRSKVRAYWAERRAVVARANALVVGAKIHLTNTKDNPFVITSVKPLYGYRASGIVYRLPRTRISHIEIASTRVPIDMAIRSHWRQHE